MPRLSFVVLTVLLVQQDLELIVNLALEAFLDPGDRLFVRQLPVHESAAAGLLHNLFGTIHIAMLPRFVSF